VDLVGWLGGSGSTSSGSAVREGISRTLAKIGAPNSLQVSGARFFRSVSMAEPLGVHGIWCSIFHAIATGNVMLHPLLPVSQSVPALCFN
jgi:hypothetical protein